MELYLNTKHANNILLLPLHLIQNVACCAVLFNQYGRFIWTKTRHELDYPSKYAQEQNFMFKKIIGRKHSTREKQLYDLLMLKEVFSEFD